MKTKDIPAIVMLLAGGVYCLLGILCQIPFLNFAIQLLIVLLAFWIMGGIIRMVLDRYMGEVEISKQENKDEETEEDAEGESKASEESEDEEESYEEESDEE